MNFNLDNFIKGPLTSIFGLIAMGASGYGWWIDHLSDWQGGALALVGFALLFMRDQIPTFVGKFIVGVLKKFGYDDKN